jgi:hypothetical protein
MGGYFPDITENQFDKLVMIVQQMQDYIDRSIKAPDSLDISDLDLTTPDPEPGKAIGWNEDGTALTNLATLEGDENGPFLPVSGLDAMLGPLRFVDEAGGGQLDWEFKLEGNLLRLIRNNADVASWSPTTGFVAAGLLYGRSGGQGIGRVTCSTSGPPSDGEAGDLHFQF